MIIDDAKSAHEFANDWLKCGSKTRARFHIQEALGKQIAIAMNLPPGERKRNHQEAANVLTLYLNDCKE